MSSKHRATPPAIWLVSLVIALLFAQASLAQQRTWRTADELSDADQALFDARKQTARDPQIPYLPAARFPFEAPFTAEEMGYRLSEFVHISRWSHALIDVFGVITSSGYINQSAGVTYIMQNADDGSAGYLYGTKAGEEYSRWLIYTVFPPEIEAEQQLWIPRRTDLESSTKMDFFVYSPQLRRVRRQPQPRRDQRFPDNAQTFDDVIGRDAWEFEWSLIGTDVLYETVRFPNTRPSMVINDATRGFVERAAGDFKPMGTNYPHYRDDGGVDCWVIKAVARPEWLPDYSEKTLIYWVDKHYFYPLRMEKYNHDDELIMIEVRNAKQEHPAREGFGYAAFMSIYWDVPHDLITYSVHDAHTVRVWTAEERDTIFTAEFMRRQWLIEPLKSQALIPEPEQYFMRPHVDRDKFPGHRKIVLSAQLAARIAAQNAAGHLVFETPSKADLAAQ